MTSTTETSTAETSAAGPAGEFAGVRVLVTGGTKGIGAAIAIRFAEAGADIVAGRTPSGEPPAGRFVAADWDFARLAPPERDLWQLAEADPLAPAAYAKATGTAIDQAALALFRMWYDLSEIAGYLCLFHAEHADTEDTAESWKNLQHFLRPADRWPQLRLPAPDPARLK